MVSCSARIISARQVTTCLLPLRRLGLQQQSVVSVDGNKVVGREMCKDFGVCDDMSKGIGRGRNLKVS